jgi:hypothetical protein
VYKQILLLHYVVGWREPSSVEVFSPWFLVEHGWVQYEYTYLHLPTPTPTYLCVACGGVCHVVLHKPSSV